MDRWKKTVTMGTVGKVYYRKCVIERFAFETLGSFACSLATTELMSHATWTGNMKDFRTEIAV